MKLRQGKVVEAVPLTRKELRAFEQLHGVYLDVPPAGQFKRTANQQFAVYDEDEVFAGVIVAPDWYFTPQTLQEGYYTMLGAIGFPKSGDPR